MQISKISSQMTTANNRQKTQNLQGTQNQKSDVSFGTIGPNLGKLLLSKPPEQVAQHYQSLPQIIDRLNNSKLHIDLIPRKFKYKYELSAKFGESSHKIAYMDPQIESESASFDRFYSFLNEKLFSSPKLTSEKENFEQIITRFDDLEDKSASFKSKMVPKLEKKLNEKIRPAINVESENITKLKTELETMKSTLFEPGATLSYKDLIQKK